MPEAAGRKADDQKLDEHFLNPKSTTEVFRLPVGWVDGDGKTHKDVQVREMTGEEEELLAGKGDIGIRLNRVLANCLVDVGGEKGTVPLVKSMAMVDRVFLLIAIRRVSLGDTYRIKAKCPSCDDKGDYTIDLGELETTETDLDDGWEFDSTLPSGRKVRWHVMTGEDEDWLKQAEKKLKGQGRMTLAILARLDELDGIKLDKSNRAMKVALTAVARLSLRDRNFLRREFEKEGDIDTKLEFECAACGAEFESEIELGSADFFFPSET